MDIVEKLKRMSQWLWVTDSDLKRNNIVKEAYEEIERLRRQLYTQKTEHAKEKIRTYIIKAEAYDALNQEGYIGFWIVSAKDIEEAFKKIRTKLLTERYNFETYELMNSNLDEMSTHYLYYDAEVLKEDCYN